MKTSGSIKGSAVSKAAQKYHFPIKRILLTRDPKDRSVSGNGLGMKVIGGKEIPGSNGLIGAYVARIYPGGVVETLGEVKEGDQVLEWNGIQLTGKTYEEVQRIIASSGDEVEIIIRSDFNMLDPYASYQQHGRSPRLGHDRGSGGSGHNTVRSSHDVGRSGGSNPRYDSPSRGSGNPHGTSTRSNPSPYDSDRPNHEYRSSRSPNPTSHIEGTSNPRYGSNPHPPSNNPAWNSSHPPNSKSDHLNDSNKYKNWAEHITGEIQLQICYDSKAAILYVTIVRARDLVTTRDNSGLPDPFVKCYLLPGRCMENQRRTRYFSRCSNPEWKQTMVYPNIPPDSLKKHHLEISVWNYDIYRPNEFLGEVVLDLSVENVIDEQARWYKLRDHQGSRSGNGPHPSSSLGQISDISGGSGRKMAKLNSLGSNEEIRKALSNQAHRMSLFPPSNMSTHPIVAQGCHAAVCSIL